MEWENIEAHVQTSTRVCVWTALQHPLMLTTPREVVSPIRAVMRCVPRTVMWVSIEMDVSEIPRDRARAVRTNRTTRTTSRVEISAMRVPTRHVL